VNEGVNFTPRGQSSPLGAKFTPRGEGIPWGPGVKLRMGLCIAICDELNGLLLKTILVYPVTNPKNRTNMCMYVLLLVLLQHWVTCFLQLLQMLVQAFACLLKKRPKALFFIYDFTSEIPLTQHIFSHF
jgi:hypothetical protein